MAATRAHLSGLSFLLSGFRSRGWAAGWNQFQAAKFRCLPLPFIERCKSRATCFESRRNVPKVSRSCECCRSMFGRNGFRTEKNGFKVIIRPGKDAFGNIAFQSLQGAAHFRRRNLPAPMLCPDRRPQFEFKKVRKGKWAFFRP
jgi:hypothetical protein